jgi:hypothetical protein
VIQEYASLMSEGLMGAVTDEQQRALEVIADRACDLNRTIDNAVDASKLMTRLHRVWRSRCRVSDLVARVRPQLLRKAALKRVDLQFSAIGKPLEIQCEKETVARAIANIVCATLNLVQNDCQMLVSEESECGAKEAGIRINVEGANQTTLAQLQELWEFKPSERSSRPRRMCELSVAAELIDRNLGRLEMFTSDLGGIALWIGFPFAEPVELLRRHLLRAMRLHPGSQRVSLFRAEVRESIHDDLSGSLNSVFNSLVGQNDLAVDLDPRRWLLTIAHQEMTVDRLHRRLERRREAVNLRRLGRPLPRILLQSDGSWQLPNDLDRILSAVGHWVERRTPTAARTE